MADSGRPKSRRTVPAACAACGRQFDARVDRLKRGYAYCSRACSGLAHQTRVTRICQREGCGNEFTASPARVAKGGARFCSIACANLAMSGPVTELRCMHCGKDLPNKRRRRGASGQPRRQFCSRTCAAAANRRPLEQRACATCQTTFKVRIRSTQRFCSSACVPRLRQRDPWARVLIACAHCTQSFSAWRGDTDRRFCSIGCYRKSIAASEQLICPCGRTYRAFASARRKGGGKACSRQCAANARRKRDVERTCDRCGATFSPRRPTQRYCNRACAGDTREITCHECGTLHRVYASQLRAGGGKFCSRDCQRAWQKRQRVKRTCARPGCGLEFEVPPSWEETRRHCSTHCWRVNAGGAAGITRPCVACGRRFRAPRWRNRRFCSMCWQSKAWYAARRPRCRPDFFKGRNDLVLKLNTQGLTAKEIAERLQKHEDHSWQLDPSGVRQVLHRERKRCALAALTL